MLEMSVCTSEKLQVMICEFTTGESEEPLESNVSVLFKTTLQKYCSDFDRYPLFEMYASTDIDSVFLETGTISF